MDLGLTNKVAVVIGGSSGIGLAAARALLDEEATVGVISRQPLGHPEFAELSTEHDQRLISMTGDYGDIAGMSRAIRSVQENLGPISILVASSGGPPPATATDIDLNQLNDAMQNNLVGIIAAVAEVLPAMLAERWGRVVLITTSGVVRPIPNLAYSNIARSALTAYASTLAAEVAAEGVTVNTVQPGKIATARLAQLTAATAKRTRISVSEQERRDCARIPTRRYGTPHEIGSVIAFLASKHASYITGAHIAVDGGYTLS